MRTRIRLPSALTNVELGIFRSPAIAQEASTAAAAALFDASEYDV
jgi:hypothetical protein